MSGHYTPKSGYSPFDYYKPTINYNNSGGTNYTPNSHSSYGPFNNNCTKIGHVIVGNCPIGAFAKGPFSGGR